MYNDNLIDIINPNKIYQYYSKNKLLAKSLAFTQSTIINKQAKIAAE